MYPWVPCRYFVKVFQRCVIAFLRELHPFTTMSWLHICVVRRRRYSAPESVARLLPTALNTSCALSCLAPDVSGASAVWMALTTNGAVSPACNDCSVVAAGWPLAQVRDQPGRPMRCSNTLMLLVHGQAFRQGSRLSTATTDSPAQWTLAALRSLHQMVLEPAVRVGWAWRCSSTSVHWLPPLRRWKWRRAAAGRLAEPVRSRSCQSDAHCAR